MMLDHLNVWLAHAFGMSFFALAAALGIGLVLFGGASVIRYPHS